MASPSDEERADRAQEDQALARAAAGRGVRRPGTSQASRHGGHRRCRSRRDQRPPCVYRPPVLLFGDRFRGRARSTTVRRRVGAQAF